MEWVVCCQCDGAVKKMKTICSLLMGLLNWIWEKSPFCETRTTVTRHFIQIKRDFWGPLGIFQRRDKESHWNRVLALWDSTTFSKGEGPFITRRDPYMIWSDRIDDKLEDVLRFQSLWEFLRFFPLFFEYWTFVFLQCTETNSEQN